MEASAISATQEDYLEAIITLESAHGRVRVRDLSDHLGVHKSTVTAALKMLTDKGLIDYEPYGRIALTVAGREAAEHVAGRHALLKRFLQDVLLLGPDAAEENACRMEHVMDAALLERLEDFHGYLRKSERSGRKWTNGFVSYLEQK